MQIKTTIYNKASHFSSDFYYIQHNLSVYILFLQIKCSETKKGPFCTKISTFKQKREQQVFQFYSLERFPVQAYFHKIIYIHYLFTKRYTRRPFKTNLSPKGPFPQGPPPTRGKNKIEKVRFLPDHHRFSFQIFLIYLKK